MLNTLLPQGVDFDCFNGGFDATGFASSFDPAGISYLIDGAGSGYALVHRIDTATASTDGRELKLVLTASNGLSNHSNAAACWMLALQQQIPLWSAALQV